MIMSWRELLKIYSIFTKDKVKERQIFSCYDKKKDKTHEGATKKKQRVFLSSDAFCYLHCCSLGVDC